MDEPVEPGEAKPEKTTVNVKNMPVQAWKRAGDRARANDETLAEWLTRAIHQLADREASGDRVIPPSRPANPAPAGRPAEDLVPLMSGVAALMQQAAALASASGRPVPPAAERDLLAAARDLSREARGVPAIRRAKPTPRIGLTVEGEG